jgi:hypothetical protein
MLVVLFVVTASSVGCAGSLRRTTAEEPTAAQIAELWVEPADLASRDLYWGAGGRALAPAAGDPFRFVALDRTGYSPGYDVADREDREWSVKLGPEAQTEVAVSRIIWAVGYHQPPTYYLSSWRLTGTPEDGPHGPGRFRPEVPERRRAGEWEWQRNPFVNTLPFRGLVVLMMILNNWDLKTSNNTVYEPDGRSGGTRWFVVRDVGAALGRTRWLFRGTRNDIEGFEGSRFIESVEGERVEIAFKYWRARTLRNDVRIRDVRWICERLNRLSEKQWQDAFRAAGYEPPIAGRYVAVIRARIAQGLALKEAA